MDQIKSKVVNVVLTIQEGKGMLENLKNSAFIAANLNGRVLESDLVPAVDCPAFNTNLIWEIEKRDLRKIRSCSQPLRVECISVDNQSRREKFGHVLLDLRCAQVVEDAGQQVTFKWHKLIGVRHRKRNHVPELFLSLTIRSQLETVPEPMEEQWEAVPRVSSTIPIKYEEDGYIRIGDEATEDYSLNILIKTASSLDLLLPEVLVFQQNNHKYCLCINMFGIPIKTKQFSRDLHDRIVFEEKIVVRLLSNLQALKAFFAEETFEIGFNCGSDLLGVTTVSFDGLTNMNEKVVLSNCYFRFPSANGIVPVGKDGRKPAMALEISLIRNHQTSATAMVTESGCGDHEETPSSLLLLDADHQIKELEEWKEKQKVEFLQELQKLKDEEFAKEREELQRKQSELNENIDKCKEMQDDLQAKLEEVQLSKTLRKKRRSSSDLLSTIEENQRKFADCDQELLIEYISQLQKDNDCLKDMINELKQEIETMQRTALTKEQTANLLQELKGLEERFEEAQQTKTYFKEQWQKACQEIHHLKTEDYRQIQNQLKERREELNDLDRFCKEDINNKLISF